MKYDIVLLGGEVVDPSQSLRGVRDVAILDGQIAALSADLGVYESDQVFDCRNQLVVPGLIDLHAHVYWGGVPIGLDPNLLCAAGGVTTILDAGSAGCGNFPAFRRFIIDQSVPEILALIHVCRSGLVCADLGELVDPRHADVKGTVATIQRNEGVAVGVKIRASEHIIGSGETGWKNFRSAIKAARESGTWLMVHIGNSPMSVPEMLQEMEPGDCITHCFRGGQTTILDDQSRPFKEVMASLEKGILFDVGHGSGSFQWEIAESAINHGFRPTSISTDLHTLSVCGPVFDMPTTMSKFLTLGLSLEEVVEMSTVNPARAVGRALDIGTLKVGSTADVAVLALEQGTFSYSDSYGSRRNGSQRLSSALTVRGGSVVPGGSGERQSMAKQWPLGRPSR